MEDLNLESSFTRDVSAFASEGLVVEAAPLWIDPTRIELRLHL